MVFGVPFHALLLSGWVPYWAPTTTHPAKRDGFWAFAISLAATEAISLDLYSSPYLDVSVRVVPLHLLSIPPKVEIWVRDDPE